ncbi:MAG: hypothetical protein IPH57_01955 [Saprospiraceae bacterium]|nr:hypothetical protein [Saprospiraceae bacterium]
MNISKSHAESERIKKLIHNNFSKDIVFTVHPDECHHTWCQHCKKSECHERKAEFVDAIPWHTENLTKESDIETKIE